MNKNNTWKIAIATGLTAIVVGVGSQVNAQEVFDGSELPDSTDTKYIYWGEQSFKIFSEQIAKRQMSMPNIPEETKENNDQMVPSSYRGFKRPAGQSTEESQSDKQMRNPYSGFGAGKKNIPIIPRNGYFGDGTTTYKGVTVSAEKHFPNAKLVGKDITTIDYFYGDQRNFEVKGLLFELENGEVLELLGQKDHYYVNQRYDITYHLIPDGASLSKKDVTKILLNGYIDHIQDPVGDLDFDGILKESELKKRE